MKQAKHNRYSGIGEQRQTADKFKLIKIEDRIDLLPVWPLPSVFSKRYGPTY